MSYEDEKKLAAEAAVDYIQSGMIVGLGSGSTASYAIRKIGDRITEGLSVIGVASSNTSANLAKSLGITLKTLNEVTKVDINIDGADEFDQYKNLIKGGGGALLREKIIAFNSEENLIIVDSRKRVLRLGAFPLPIEVIPLTYKKIIMLLSQEGLAPELRGGAEAPFITDEGNYIIDLKILKISDIVSLNNYLKSVPGVVETGLFINLASKVLIGEGKKVITLC